MERNGLRIVAILALGFLMLQAYLTRAQTVRMVSITRHDLSGAVLFRLYFAGLSFGFSGDTRDRWPLVRACEEGVVQQLKPDRKGKPE